MGRPSLRRTLQGATTPTMKSARNSAAPARAAVGPRAPRPAAAMQLSRSSSVDGLQNGNRVCWNGSHELVTAAADCGANAPVYQITALAVTPSGSRRMLQYEETINIMVPVVAALYAQNAINTGQALNVTGATD